MTNDARELGSWQEVVHEIYAGATVGSQHGWYFLKKNALAFIDPVLGAFGIQDGQKKTTVSQNEPQDLKVIGVGYGRTGTYSLTLALEELGIPTLHTQHLYEHDDIFEMWENEVFQPSIAAQKAELRTPDFDVLTKNGYQATMDFPMALYFEQVHERYPDCKFILTVRDNSEVWYKSWDTMTRSITQPTRLMRSWINNVRRLSMYLRWLFAIVNKDNSYITTEFPRPEQIKAASIASYEEHNRRVREVIPPNQLLEYSVKEGWEPLCKFLEIDDCPTTPFPKTNSALSLQVQTISAMVIPLVLTLFVIFYLFSCTFQRTTGLTVLQWLNLKSTQALHHLAAMGRGEKVAHKNA